MGKHYNIQPGDIFGRLTVIGQVTDAIDKNTKKHMSRFLCKCSCPDHNSIIVMAKNLTNGNTKSCGCLLKENAAALHTGIPAVHPEYTPMSIYFPNVIYAYYTMIYDAYHGIDQAYGQQIPICGEWIESENNNVKKFYDEMCSTYEPGCKIRRLDKSKGFSPSNCYWGTKSYDPDDMINDKFIEYNGFTYTASEWNRALGYKKNTIKNRILNGYDDLDAITGKLDDMDPVNAIYFVNEYGRPINKEATEFLYD